jgi:hypothetical protein
VRDESDRGLARDLRVVMQYLVRDFHSTIACAAGPRRPGTAGVLAYPRPTYPRIFT